MSVANWGLCDMFAMCLCVCVCLGVCSRGAAYDSQYSVLSDELCSDMGEWKEKGEEEEGEDRSYEDVF